MPATRDLAKPARLHCLKWTLPQKIGDTFDLCERFRVYKEAWDNIMRMPGLVGVTDEALASWILASTPPFLHAIIVDSIEDGLPPDPMVSYH